MKRLLLPLLAALALPTAVSAGVDPAVHNLCKDVSDYMGCVKANKNLKTELTKTGKIFGFRFVQNPDEGRLFVWDILKGSVSEKEDLRFGDEIIQINDIDISLIKPQERTDKVSEELKKPTVNLKVKRFFRDKNQKKPQYLILEKDLTQTDMRIKIFEWTSWNNQELRARDGAMKWNMFVNYLYPRGSRVKTFKLINGSQEGTSKGRSSYNSDGYFIKQQMHMNRMTDNYKRYLDNYQRDMGY